jgi:hypothetical protein
MQRARASRRAVVLCGGAVPHATHPHGCSRRPLLRLQRSGPETGSLQAAALAQGHGVVRHRLHGQGRWSWGDALAVAAHAAQDDAPLAVARLAQCSSSAASCHSMAKPCCDSPRRGAAAPPPWPPGHARRPRSTPRWPTWQPPGLTAPCGPARPGTARTSRSPVLKSTRSCAAHTQQAERLGAQLARNTAKEGQNGGPEVRWLQDWARQAAVARLLACAGAPLPPPAPRPPRRPVTRSAAPAPGGRRGAHGSRASAEENGFGSLQSARQVPPPSSGGS